MITVSIIERSSGCIALTHTLEKQADIDEGFIDRDSLESIRVLKQECVKGETDRVVRLKVVMGWSRREGRAAWLDPDSCRYERQTRAPCNCKMRFRMCWKTDYRQVGSRRRLGSR